MRLIHADLLHFIFFGPTIHAQGTSTSLRYQHEVAAFQRFNVSAIEPLQIIVSLRGFLSLRYKWNDLATVAGFSLYSKVEQNGCSSSGFVRSYVTNSRDARNLP